MGNDNFNSHIVSKFFDMYKKILSETSNYVGKQNSDIVKKGIEKHFKRSRNMIDHIKDNVLEGIKNSEQGLNEINQIYKKFVDFAYKMIFSYTDPYNRDK